MKRLCLFHPCEQSATTATVYVNYEAINRYQVLPTPPSRCPNIQRGKRTHFIHLSDSRCHPEGCKDLRPLFVNTGVLMHLVWKTPHAVQSSDFNHAIWSSNRSGNINSVILRKKCSVIQAAYCLGIVIKEKKSYCSTVFDVIRAEKGLRRRWGEEEIVFLKCIHVISEDCNCTF